MHFPKPHLRLSSRRQVRRLILAFALLSPWAQSHAASDSESIASCIGLYARQIEEIQHLNLTQKQLENAVLLSRSLDKDFVQVAKTIARRGDDDEISEKTLRALKSLPKARSKPPAAEISEPKKKRFKTKIELEKADPEHGIEKRDSHSWLEQAFGGKLRASEAAPLQDFRDRLNADERKLFESFLDRLLPETSSFGAQAILREITQGQWKTFTEKQARELTTLINRNWRHQWKYEPLAAREEFLTKYDVIAYRAQIQQGAVDAHSPQFQKKMDGRISEINAARAKRDLPPKGKD